MERKQPTRIFTLLTILLFLSITFFIPGITGVTTSKNTVSDPEIVIDISTVTTTIQDAINNAQPNSTIQLPAGIYTEILTINKPLHLKGEGTSRTLLSPTSGNNGYAIRISAEGVTLSGLDITNQGIGLYTTGVKISASNTTIQNCTFHDTPIGIAIWSSKNTISGCDFKGCDDEGIVLLGTSTTACNNNTIISCDFYENCDGIELQYATDNLITSCTFTQNTHAGIDAIESNNNNNIISYCKFTDNQAFGLYLARSSYNLITQCTFSDDTVTFIQATDNTLLRTQVAHVNLMEDSSLLIEQCKDINTSDIISQQSSFEIRTDQSEQISQEKNSHTTVYHPLLLSLLSRFKILKSLYEQLRQSRM
jgi:parallel beta-helix repeat protein